MARVLVLNANTRQSLVAVRSLGQRGLGVTSGADRRLATAALSRYADRHLQHPDPTARPDAFVDAVEAELAGGAYDLVLPLNDATVVPTVQHTERLEAHAAVPFLPYDDLLAGLDKRHTIEAARDRGVPHPTSSRWPTTSCRRSTGAASRWSGSASTRATANRS